VRRLARRVLQRSGYQVLEAGDGEEALRVAAAHDGRIDLLLTDVVMPRMGGLELAEKLLEMRPGVGVLYFTGYTDEAVARHGELAPGAGFIEKPFSPDALAARVRQAVHAAQGDPT
jgi:CheY-like chemotaxis protein